MEKITLDRDRERRRARNTEKGLEIFEAYFVSANQSASKLPTS
jgi:hypothetical protein